MTYRIEPYDNFGSPSIRVTAYAGENTFSGIHSIARLENPELENRATFEAIARDFWESLAWN